MVKNINTWTIKDTVSASDIYYGYAKIGTATNKPLWHIIREVTTGSITKRMCPDGSTESKFIWDNRTAYTYK